MTEEQKRDVEEEQRATLRRSSLDLLDDVIQANMHCLQGEAGRPESAELTLAWRQLQKARWYIREHLERTK